MKIKFKYKDAYTRGNWSYQECDVSSVEECKKIYGLGIDCEYQILSVDEILTREGKLDYLEKLKNHPKVINFGYDEDILQDGRDDSLWYGGDVLWFDIVDEKGEIQYKYSLIATGEVRITHIPTDDDVILRNDCSSDVVEFFEQHNINNDKEIAEAEENGDIYFENNNWFEDMLYDKDGNYILGNYEMGISDGPFTTTVEDVLNLIKDYEENK